MENPASNYQAAEDFRLLERYPTGVVPPWNSALCKEMLLEWFGEGSEEHLIAQSAITSPCSDDWIDHGGDVRSPWDLFKLVTECDPIEDRLFYKEESHAWRERLVQRALEADKRRRAVIVNEGREP